MKRILTIVGVCLLAFIIIASTAATKQELTLRAILSEVNHISKLELRSVVDLIDPTPYIWIPPGCKEWTNEEPPVIALSPASKEAKAVWACDMRGQEILLSLEKPPKFPVVVITAEPPAEGNIYFKEKERAKEKGAVTNKASGNDIYYLHVDTLRYWGQWDPWPCTYFPEIHYETIIWDGHSDTYEISTGNMKWYDPVKDKWRYPYKKCGKNNGSDNCNCANKPRDGDHGYYYGSPGKYIGNTTPDYPRVYRVRFWDNDVGWCEKINDPNPDEMEIISGDEIGNPPQIKWCYGDRGGCRNLDVHIYVKQSNSK